MIQALPVRDAEIEIEACSTCDRLVSTVTRCACCERPVCRDCARVQAGVVWCEACIDESWDLLPSENVPTAPSCRPLDSIRK